MRSSSKVAYRTRIPTRKERYKMGSRDYCDICRAKIGAPIVSRGRKTNKKVEIFTFTVKGARGRLFNRCRCCLRKPIPVNRRGR
jgi:hypothetical protein